MSRRCLPLLAWIVIVSLVPGQLLAQKSADERRRLDARRGFLTPQLAVADDGSVYMLWTRPLESGHDLYVSVRDPNGIFGAAVRVNDRPGSVRYIAFDEYRPAIATGPSGAVAVAWTDVDHQVRIATSTRGKSFRPSIAVNRAGGKPERGFVTLAYDPQGVLHVAWIDARNAPRGMEEPAQIYYARYVEGRAVAEVDLTGNSTASVCGCCRPAVHADRYGVSVLYRNVGADGYRDVFRIQGTLSGKFDDPVRLGPPRWRIEGCPSMGPIYDGGMALWRDGAEGRLRILAFVDGAGRPEVVVSATADWSPALSPRWVSGAPSAEPLVLVPGDPNGLIVSRRGGKWIRLNDQVPHWCSSAALVAGQVLLVGEHYGELRQEALRLATGR